MDMEIHQELVPTSYWLSMANPFACNWKNSCSVTNITEVLLDFLPHKKEYEKTLPKNKRYIRIQNLLKNENTLKIQMCSLKSIGAVFTDFF